MRKLLLASTVALASLFTIASPAAARSVTCDGVKHGKIITRDLTVPPGAACELVNSIVRGDVKVRAHGYFQATNTLIHGDVDGTRAQTLFIEDGSLVRGDVEGDRTAQVFVFGSKVRGEIEVRRATDKVNICGNTVREDIRVVRSGRDILVGDPRTSDCPGNNVVQRGDIRIENNITDVELVVRGNRINRGNLIVRQNRGPAAKVVQDNAGGNMLVCTGNDPLFTASGNTAWLTRSGQCGTP
jgi:hypothetical protein